MVNKIFSCIFLFLCQCVWGSHEVLTLGDAIVDHILFVEESFLNRIGGEKGGSELINDQQFYALLNSCGYAPSIVPGGSAVNVMKGLSRMGHRCKVIGKIGNDSMGDLFLSRLLSYGVTPSMISWDRPTAQSLCLITPDGERTMRTSLGVCLDQNDIPLNKSDFSGIRLFHVEGYQLRNEALVKRAIQLAKEEKAKISFDLGCFELVETKRALIIELLKGSIDLLFCNEKEAEVLTRLGPEKACEFLSKFCEVVVVTAGEKGCFAQQGQEKIRGSAFAVSVKDSTGAGDLFASGFLHGYLEGKSLKTCVYMASLSASEVIQVFGAEIPLEKWDAILKAF